MVALSFPPKSSRLRLPLGRLYDFPPFGGARWRLRVAILLTSVVVFIVLLVSFLRGDNGVYKFHLDLGDEQAEFQRQYIAEHAALGE